MIRKKNSEKQKPFVRRGLTSFALFILAFGNASLTLGESVANNSKVYTKQQAINAVEHAEEIRNFDQSESMVKMITLQENRKPTEYFLNVLQRTGRKLYIEFIPPGEDVGRRMLAIKTDYWARFQDSPTVIRISSREAMGNSAFSLADVFQMDTKTDYDPTIATEIPCKSVASEKFKEALSASCYVVELNAKHDEAPYHQIKYFVRTSDSYPVRAEFYGISNQLIKTLTVEKNGNRLGMTRPTELKMVDQIVKGRITYWYSLKSSPRSVPESVFSQSYLTSH